MERMIYLAMTGAREAMTAQTMNVHNLANVNTPGFRADIAAARSQPVYGPGLPTRVYSMAERAGVNFNHGGLMQTGRDLDVGIQGDGWIAVQAPDGNEAYTRAGDMRISPNGILETGAGLAVMGNTGPIALPPVTKIHIGNDGSISIQPQGGQPKALAFIDRIKLVNPPLDQLRKLSDGLIHMNGGGVAAADAGVRLVSGSIERSNVNAIDAMIGLIEKSRQFEMQVKLMQEAKRNDEKSTDILRIT